MVVGATDGVSVGATDGVDDGVDDGVSVGATDGVDDGVDDGATVGRKEGTLVGFIEGRLVGLVGVDVDGVRAIVGVPVNNSSLVQKGSSYGTSHVTLNFAQYKNAEQLREVSKVKTLLSGNAGMLLRLR